MADIINLGGILAVKMCRGPIIPITFGRIDATKKSAANNLPDMGSTFDNQLKFFKNADMSEIDLVTLGMGGHTLGK